MVEVKTNKQLLNVVIVILLSIGVGNGLILFFNQPSPSSHFIPREQAVRLLWEAVNCNGYLKKPATAIVELVHVVNSTRQYYVDEKNMGDFALAYVLHPEPIGDDRYVWQITGDCYHTDKHGTTTDTHYVDAKTGKLVV